MADTFSKLRLDLCPTNSKNLWTIFWQRVHNCGPFCGPFFSWSFCARKNKFLTNFEIFVSPSMNWFPLEVDSPHLWEVPWCLDCPKNADDTQCVLELVRHKSLCRMNHERQCTFWSICDAWHKNTWSLSCVLLLVLKHTDFVDQVQQWNNNCRILHFFYPLTPGIKITCLCSVYLLALRSTGFMDQQSPSPIIPLPMVVLSTGCNVVAQLLVRCGALQRCTAPRVK